MARSVFLFERRFVPRIIDGTKTGTIRQRRKRPVESGDWMLMRYWQDKPYRSPQVTFAEKEVDSVSFVEIDFTTDFMGVLVQLGERALFRGELPAFARADGFRSLVDFRHYWVHRRGVLRFRGDLIRWR